MIGTLAWGVGCLLGSTAVMSLAHAASDNDRPGPWIRWVIVGNALIAFTAGMIVWQVIA